MVNEISSSDRRYVVYCIATLPKMYNLLMAIIEAETCSC